MLNRDAAAVADFLKTNYTLHIIRDNPSHSVPIMVGTLGVSQTKRDRKELKSIRNTIFSQASVTKNDAGNTYDQKVIEVRSSFSWTA